MDSRFCSLTASLKNEKIQKDKVQSVKDWKNTKKNTKIQIAFLDAMEKYKKKYKNTRCIFYILFVFFVFFLYVYQKNGKLQKNTKKYECNCSKIQNTKKIRINNIKNTKYKKKYEPKISKIQNTKKNTNPKFQKYKIQRKDKFKNKPESQPRVHFWKSGTKIQKKIQNQPVVFSKPCSSDFVFLGCIFFVFFLYF